MPRRRQRYETGYGYDGLNRLTQEKLTDARTPANGKTTDYVYGPPGNRQSKTETQGGTVTVTGYQYDPDDRLTTETKTQGTNSQTTSYAWDANGNLTRKTEPNQVTLYGWDGDNRMIQVKKGPSEATAQTVASYRYDAQGNRIGKTLADGTQIAYLVDGNMPYAQVVEEKATNGANTESTVYLYGIERIRQMRGGQGSYYLGDGLGSTRLLTDDQGNLTDSYDYEAYGNLENQTGTTRNSYLFAGEQFDSEAGLYYNRARCLDTGTGTFVSLDQFAGSPRRPASLSKYAYANGDPVNVRDPSGNLGMGDALGAMSVMVTLGYIAYGGYQLYQGILFGSSLDLY